MQVGLFFHRVLIVLVLAGGKNRQSYYQLLCWATLQEFELEQPTSLFMLMKLVFYPRLKYSHALPAILGSAFLKECQGIASLLPDTGMNRMQDFVPESNFQLGVRGCVRACVFDHTEAHTTV